MCDGFMNILLSPAGIFYAKQKFVLSTVSVAFLAITMYGQLAIKYLVYYKVLTGKATKEKS